MKRGLTIVTVVLGFVTAAVGIATAITSIVNITTDKEFRD